MENILEILNTSYPISFDSIELVRDMGSTSYTVFSGTDKYFLRIVKPSLFDTAVAGVDIQVFLQKRNFPVPAIIFTNQDLPYIKKEEGMLILYEFIEGSDSDPEQDAEAIGALIGRLHQVMKEYPGELIKCDKHFYIERYIEILRKKQYPKVDEYAVYGDALWEKIKNLPRGYCHGDMYNGNIRKSANGKLYIHDFDTSCEGFPMYDLTLICDMTEYFNYNKRNFDKSNKLLARAVPEYQKYNSLFQTETDAFHDLIALQHFSTQATIMEIFGLDCINNTDIDNQLEWLYKWKEQCEQSYGI